MGNSIHNRMSFYFGMIFICFLVLCFLLLAFSYAQSEQRLKVGISLYTPPIFLDDTDSSTIQGISVDIGKMFADNMDSTVQFYAIDVSDYEESLEKGFVDFIIGIKDDFKNFETLDLIEMDIRIYRRFFVNSECNTFTSLKDLPGHSVIVRSGNFPSWFLTSRSDTTFIDTETEEEGFALLNSGKVQVYISHSRLLDLDTIKKRGFHNIKEVGSPIEGSPLVIASNKKNLELNASLSKAYEKALASTRYNRILNLWMSKDMSLINANKNNMMLFISALFKYIKITLGIIILAFLGIIFWNNTLKRKVNKVKKDLYQSEQRYKDLIESSPEMIHLVSPDGKIRLSNKMALMCLGYDENEIKSFKLHDLVSPEEVDKVTVFLDKVLKTNYSKDEFNLLVKGGESIRVEMIATIVKWNSNGESLVCTFSRDLTERIHLEENLIHAERLAVIGQMAAGIAHEINNPLGIILTNIGVLTKHKLNEEDFNGSLNSIERNALRAAKIIEDLLSFTRPSPMKKASFNLILLIDESLLFLKQKIKNKDIKIEKLYSSSSLNFCGDERMIQQLLINLLINAIQAVRDKGKITLVTELNNNMISIEIKDNGVGIPKDDIPKICNPFFTSQKKGGFGLGLFISKIIVEKHNGNIFFKSDLHKGTIVTIELPLGVETTLSVTKNENERLLL